MIKFISKYFNAAEEYPTDIAENILPIGTWQAYVSTTYLNGFINHVNIKSAWLLSRYEHWNSTEDNNLRTISVRAKEDKPLLSYNLTFPDSIDLSNPSWPKFKGTKKERFELLTEKDRTLHCQFSDFGDDVLILASANSNDSLYYVFWFDMDCSDSCIGRFNIMNCPQDSDEAIRVVDDFNKCCKNIDMEYITPREENHQIPLHYFNGWLRG